MKQWVFRHPWLAVGILTAVLFLGGFLVMASGVIPIKASSGHWAITERILHFAMRRSVATHAMFVSSPPPDLDSDAFVLRGAGHYETGCRPCHGAPGDAMPRIARAMTPHPPWLSDRVTTWSSEQLFYIVKHGVKFTGMPAWPAQSRDDEVWAMVGFLRRLPSLDADDYQQLVKGGGTDLAEMAAGADASTPTDAPSLVADLCARCHGADGTGRGHAAFPKLAGQRLEYLSRAMRAYATRERHSGIMGPIARGLTDDATREALAYYAALPAGGATAALIGSTARGEAIARRGVPEREIPSCAKCHAPRDVNVNSAYPVLDGQYASYLAGQLRLMQSRSRGGSEYLPLMHSFVDRLDSAQIEDVSAYFASRTARPLTPGQ